MPSQSPHSSLPFPCGTCGAQEAFPWAFARFFPDRWGPLGLTAGGRGGGGGGVNWRVTSLLYHRRWLSLLCPSLIPHPPPRHLLQAPTDAVALSKCGRKPDAPGPHCEPPDRPSSGIDTRYGRPSGQCCWRRCVAESACGSLLLCAGTCVCPCQGVP